MLPELKMFNVDCKPEHKQKQLRQREEVSWRMHEVVDKVFRPQEQMTGLGTQNQRIR